MNTPRRSARLSAISLKKTIAPPQQDATVDRLKRGVRIEREFSERLRTETARLYEEIDWLNRVSILNLETIDKLHAEISVLRTANDDLERNADFLRSKIEHEEHGREYLAHNLAVARAEFAAERKKVRNLADTCRALSKALFAKQSPLTDETSNESGDEQ